MDLFVIRRRGAFADLHELEAIAPKSAQVGNEEMPDRVRWIRSYAVDEPDGRVGTVCVYEATDTEAIREHDGRVGIPGDDIVRVLNTVRLRPDPE